VAIRPAVPGDENVLAVLSGIAHELHLAAHPEFMRATRQYDVAQWFGSLLRQPAAAAWLAEDDGVPVGYVLALFQEQPENPFRIARRWCEIDQLAVTAERRRRGVARALVDAVVAEARANGIRDVELNVWTFNRDAEAVFRKLGFQPRASRWRLQLPGATGENS
jgi:GNAT superfamily N-acetyltransferase